MSTTEKPGVEAKATAGKTKTHQTTGLETLNHLLKISGLKPTAIAAELGVTDSGLSGWRTAGKMPKMAAVACEGLARRFSGVKRVHILVTVESSQSSQVKSILGSIVGITDIQELKL